MECIVLAVIRLAFRLLGQERLFGGGRVLGDVDVLAIVFLCGVGSLTSSEGLD